MRPISEPAHLPGFKAVFISELYDKKRRRPSIANCFVVVSLNIFIEARKALVKTTVCPLKLDVGDSILYEEAIVLQLTLTEDLVSDVYLYQ